MYRIFCFVIGLMARLLQHVIKKLSLYIELLVRVFDFELCSFGGGNARGSRLPDFLCFTLMRLHKAESFFRVSSGGDLADSQWSRAALQLYESRVNRAVFLL